MDAKGQHEYIGRTVQLVLTVDEVRYAKGADWRRMQDDAEKALCLSVDPEFDESIPLERLPDGEMAFAADYVCLRYNLDVRASNSAEMEKAAIECIALLSPIILMDWFGDIGAGTWLVKLRFCEPIEFDDERALEWVGIENLINQDKGGEK